MFDTKDLTSYIPGYDDYCEPKEIIIKYDYSDEYCEEKNLRKELEKMDRNIIDLEVENILFDDTLALENYVWQGTKLVPVEMIEGK